MNINNRYNNTISFKGYDARRLAALAMNSNFGGVASELKKIGEKENFLVLLFDRTGGGCKLKLDEFEHIPEPIDCSGMWAQDLWGITNNTLLFAEPCAQASTLMRVLKMVQNKTQAYMQDVAGLNQLKDYIFQLMHQPRIVVDGQEVACILKDNKVQQVPICEVVEEIQKCKETFEWLQRSTHPKGGNYFIVKGSDGKDEVLIGENVLANRIPREYISKIFETDKVHSIPLADYHLDLFIRPLKDRKVLVADDNMTLDVLTQQIEKIKQWIKNQAKINGNDVAAKERCKKLWIQCAHSLELFSRATQGTKFENADKVVEALEKAGFEPIRVPGRVFHLTHHTEPNGEVHLAQKNLHNYLNAIVQVNDKGEVVYITNKSTFENNNGLTDEILNEIDCGLQKAFEDVVKPHVDRFYYVSGKDNVLGNSLLPNYYGGVHCSVMEVPNIHQFS